MSDKKASELLKESEKPFYEACKKVEELEKELEYKQMLIDNLMMEYCEDEMTEEQLENYFKHQKMVNVVL